jgi:HSP20 family protein
MVGPFGLSPFSLMRRMMEDLDRFFEGFGSGRGFDLGSFSGPELRGLSVWSPPIEVFERDRNFVVRADLPGLSPDDVRIEAADDSIVIEGERRSEMESEEQGIYRSERAYGRFSRVIPLPAGADAQKAQARFENGVLEITVPIEEATSGRRRIEIQAGSGSGGQRRSGESSVH